MKLWVVCFVILFGSFELFQWICQFSWFSNAQLSLPVAVVGGIALAIASNYERMAGLPFNSLAARNPQSDGLSDNQSIPSQTAKPLNQSDRQPISFQILTQSKRSISFEIPKTSNREASN